MVYVDTSLSYTKRRQNVFFSLYLLHLGTDETKDAEGKGGGDGQLGLACVCVNICRFKYPYFSLNVSRPSFPNSL